MVVALSVSGFWYFGGCEPLEYPVGKDTVDWFANGRFQVLRSMGSPRTS